ncbi:ankyrin repeat-containing protein ITN1-like [Impatiens glandulifera]|uniref:ankyrin repeat-containing protein ITN1-like n=1 Tax=Impatiens glandulifera TaxID=253017 RepID=UPI001FB17663|nr:ankyrin repeat-containing protein ITN1-like [Impatiens glandulifera]
MDYIERLEPPRTDEQELYKAATSDDTVLFLEIFNKNWNKDILYMCKFGYFGYSILHVAASNKSIHIVDIILKESPGLLYALDSRKWSALHLALVKGDTIMSEELLSRNPYVARVKTSHGDSILHMCLKHGQLGSLRLLMDKIKDTEFANLTDAEGNTVLHLGVMISNFEAVDYLFKINKVKVNAKNTIGNTALDIALECTETIRDDRIQNILKENGATRSKHMNQVKWLSEKRNVLIVLASIIATMTFQAGVNPPGGTWQDSSDILHQAGESVMAYYSGVYIHFLSFNTLALMGSLITILLLLMGLPSGKGIVMKLPVTIMWLTILVMIFTYSASITMTTPIGLRVSLLVHITAGGLGLGFIITAFRWRHRVQDLKEFICRKLELFGGESTSGWLNCKSILFRGLPFHFARNPHYIKSYTLDANSNIPSYVPPCYNALRTTLLEKERAHIERLLEPIKTTWKEKGVTIVSDGWTTVREDR